MGYKATPHKARLTALYAICLHIFRHLAQKFLDRRQPACEISIQSDEKSDSASYAQALCGAALTDRRKKLLRMTKPAPKKKRERRTLLIPLFNAFKFDFMHSAVKLPYEAQNAVYAVSVAFMRKEMQT